MNPASAIRTLALVPLAAAALAAELVPGEPRPKQRQDPRPPPAGTRTDERARRRRRGF